jgi:arginyl-tRNA synthetase
MIQGEIKRALSEAIKKAYPEIDLGEIRVERTKDPGFGDFTTNASMRIASALKTDPLVISKNIVANIQGDLFNSEVASGFINFRLAEDYFQKQLEKILKEKNNYGSSNILAKKKIQVEFISANPTGPLHLGNGRGGFGGDVIANVLTRLGAKVEREYYVNDAGTQIKTLGESALVAAGLKKDTGELYRGEWIDKWVKGKKTKLIKMADKPEDIGEILAAEILTKYIKPTIKDMKINFDVWFSEKSLEKEGLLEKTIKDFESKGLIYEEEGAKWFRATRYGDTNDHVLMRSDGVPAYYLGDVAYHRNKFIARKFNKVINIWGADHHGHVERVLAAVRAMGQAGKLDIIITQLVRLVKDGVEFKMSKRKGNFVTMDDLFELIGGPKKEASDVARFFFLSRAFNTHMDFDLDLASEHSEKNPVFYVKYAHARICGILRKAKDIKKGKTDLNLLTNEKEIELIKELSLLPEILIAIAADRTYPIHHLAFYSRSIAQKFHSFYDACKVIDEGNPELTKARLKLVEATQIVLAIVMKDLIGIDAPDRM